MVRSFPYARQMEIISHCIVELSGKEFGLSHRLGSLFRSNVLKNLSRIPIRWRFMQSAAKLSPIRLPRREAAYLNPRMYRTGGIGLVWPSLGWFAASRYFVPLSDRCNVVPHAAAMTEITYRDDTKFSINDILPIYRACDWSAANKPEQLLAALKGSDSVVHAHAGDRMVGLANAISDGHLVVYYPHLLVHPDFSHAGIGTALMQRLISQYNGFHQHMLTADGNAISFYERLGFRRAGKTVPMWIYDGSDH